MPNTKTVERRRHVPLIAIRPPEHYGERGRAEAQVRAEAREQLSTPRLLLPLVPRAMRDDARRNGCHYVDLPVADEA